MIFTDLNLHIFLCSDRCGSLKNETSKVAQIENDGNVDDAEMPNLSAQNSAEDDSTEHSATVERSLL